MRKPSGPARSRVRLAAIAFMGACHRGPAGTSWTPEPGKPGMIPTPSMSRLRSPPRQGQACMTLKGPQGNLSPSSPTGDQEFRQAQVGDQVDMKYVEAVTVELLIGGGMIVSLPSEGRGRRQARCDACRHDLVPRGHERGRRRRRGPRAANDHAQGADAQPRPRVASRSRSSASRRAIRWTRSSPGRSRCRSSPRSERLASCRRHGGGAAGTGRPRRGGMNQW